MTKEELGGVGVADTSGSVDVVVDTEQAAFEATRMFLSFLPSSVDEIAPAVKPKKPCCNATSLDEIIPKDVSQGFDIYKVLFALIDE